MRLESRFASVFHTWPRLYFIGLFFIIVLFSLLFFFQFQMTKMRLIENFQISSFELESRNKVISKLLGQRLFLLENSAAMQRVINDPSELATVGLLSEWRKFSLSFEFRDLLYYIDINGEVVLRLNHENEQPVINWGDKRTTALTQYFSGIKWAVPGQMYQHKIGGGENTRYFLYLAVFDKWANLHGFIVQEFEQRQLNRLVSGLAEMVTAPYQTIFQSNDWNSFNDKSEETLAFIATQMSKASGSTDNTVTYEKLAKWEELQDKHKFEIETDSVGLLLIRSLPGFINSRPIYLFEYLGPQAIFAHMRLWFQYWLSSLIIALLLMAIVAYLWRNWLESQRLIMQEQDLRLAAFEGGHSQLVADAHGKVIAVNSYHCRLVGMRKEDLLGLDANAFMANMHPSFQEIIQSSQEYSGWHGEVSWENSKGEKYDMLASITVLFDQHGHIERYVISGVDLSAQKKLEKQLQELADTDPLTGCLNRRAFDVGLAREFARSSRSKQVFSLLMLDIDHFKEVNDNYGHDVGDKVLIELVSEVNQHIRTADTLARWGGEEFILLLPETSGEQAVKLAERLRCAFAERTTHPVYTASIGVCEAGGSGLTNRDQLFKEVDQALYQAKSTGRNKVVLATPVLPSQEPSYESEDSHCSDPEE